MHHQLEALVQVVRRGSVTGAAQALYVTQPALTARLNALERDVGTRLDGLSVEAESLPLNVRVVTPGWKLSFSRGVATRVDGFSTGFPSRRGSGELKALKLL